MPLGCIGMRINTGISDEVMLMAAPKESIESLEAELPALTKVHQDLELHYRKRIEDVSKSQYRKLLGVPDDGVDLKT